MDDKRKLLVLVEVERPGTSPVGREWAGGALEGEAGEANSKYVRPGVGRSGRAE